MDPNVTITENNALPQHVSQEALSLIIKAEIDTKISTAKAFPRSMESFMKGAMSMATINEDVAASCNYTVARGGSNISGPSVRLAEIVCANYGNIIAGARVIANDGKTVTAQGFCHDLEKNYSVQVEVKRRITNKQGFTFSEDMQVVTGNAACAIAYRNAVYKVVPAALIDSIYEKTREIVRGTAETLAARRKKAVDYFVSIKVSEKQLFEKLGVKGMEDIDLDRLLELNGMRSAIKSGEETINSMFMSEEDIDAAKKSSQEKIKEMTGGDKAKEDKKKDKKKEEKPEEPVDPNDPLGLNSK